MVWAREIERQPVDTPERRAGLETRLAETVAAIREPRVRAHYGKDFAGRLERLFRPDLRRQWTSPGQNWTSRDVRRTVSGAVRRSPLTRLAGGRDQVETLLVLAVLNHPELLDGHFEAFAELELANAKLDRLRNEIIRIASGGPLDRGQLHNQLSDTSVAGLARDVRDRSTLTKDHPFVRPEASLGDAERGWSHLVNWHWGVDRLRAELRAAEQALAHDMTEENFARLQTVRAQVHAAEQAERERAAADPRD